MLRENAVRHQMVLPEQQSIFDYWRSRCKNGSFPSRFDIEPEHIIKHLPTVSVIEVKGTAALPRFRYRLAGTGFWPLYEAEIQGRYIDELPIGDRRDYWNRVLMDMLTKRQATTGVTRTGTPTGGHLAQFWIRMPLSSDGETIDMILGYDHLVKLTDIKEPQDDDHKLFA